MNTEHLKAELIRDEDLRTKPYRCSAGFQTIGVGHNLDAKPISKRAAMVILEDDIADTVSDLDSHQPWWRNMNEARQHVILNMCFNLGIVKLMKFKNTLRAMKEERWEAACSGMKASLWYRQVGARAVRLVLRMRTGE